MLILQTRTSKKNLFGGLTFPNKQFRAIRTLHKAPHKGLKQRIQRGPF